MVKKLIYSGFLLIEMCVSCLVLTFCSLLIAYWCQAVLAVQEGHKKRVQALFLAHSCIEEYKISKHVSSLKADKEFSLDYKITPDKKLPSYADVSVTVSWLVQKKPVSLTLRTGVRW